MSLALVSKESLTKRHSALPIVVLLDMDVQCSFSFYNFGVFFIIDGFQVYLMFSLVFILMIGACANPNNRITNKEFAVASNWETDGFVAPVTLA